jgi:hypothetical protein
MSLRLFIGIVGLAETISVRMANEVCGYDHCSGVIRGHEAGAALINRPENASCAAQAI